MVITVLVASHLTHGICTQDIKVKLLRGKIDNRLISVQLRASKGMQYFNISISEKTFGIWLEITHTKGELLMIAGFYREWTQNKGPYKNAQIAAIGTYRLINYCYYSSSR